MGMPFLFRATPQHGTPAEGLIVRKPTRRRQGILETNRRHPPRYEFAAARASNPLSGQYALMKVVDARRAAVITELRGLVAECGTDRARTSVPTVTAGIPAASFTADEYAVLIAAARPDESQKGWVRRLRWWVFLSLAAETDLDVHGLLALTWSDLISLPLSPVFRTEVLAPQYLVSLRTSSWREATGFAREVEQHPFPWSASGVRRKLARLGRSTGAVYRADVGSLVTRIGR